ncbi:thiamine-binding protein [Virgibacillus halodenitrificans]|uniref:Thiamine-binding protein n=1 Tax=Virgibacillus halodenitrificans TaxID=1482 RepID=A0ABR7VHL7_VIRHA|nr:thiamine-binding protein [Virgibacillus halodenitrificans]MBD1221427.1 thiamine-binding protein [Virgibacillus halodenitrificans]
MANSLVSIQIIPKADNVKDVYGMVDEAIAIIDEAGVTYQVNPLETTMEGELSELLHIVEKMNARMVEIGAENVISQIKILHQPSGITTDTLTEKYR